jgi:hypothetical protein
MARRCPLESSLDPGGMEKIGGSTPQGEDVFGLEFPAADPEF